MISLTVQGQEKEKSAESGKTGFFLSVSYTAPITSKIDFIIHNDLVNTGNEVKLSQKFAPLNFKADLSYMVTEKLGFCLGYSMHSYKTEMSLASFTSTFSTLDTEKDVIEQTVTAKNVVETQDFMFFDLPLYLKYQNSFGGGKLGYYVNVGVVYSAPLKKDYKGTGTFTYSGYYPKYNVTLQNLPQYDFPTDVVMTKTGTMDVNPHFGYMLAAGLNFQLGERANLFCGVEYLQSLSQAASFDLVNYSVSQRKGEYSSLSDLSTSYSIQQVNFEIGLKFKLFK